MFASKPPTWKIRWFVAVTLVALASTVVAACGDSDPKAEAPVVTKKEASAAIAKQLTDSNVLDAKTAQCIGDDVAPKISSKGRTLTKSSVDSVEKLSADDKKVLSSGFDTCVTSQQMAQVIANGTAGAALGADSPVTACLTTKLTDKFPTSGLMFQGLFGRDNQAAIISMMTECGVPGISPPTS